MDTVNVGDEKFLYLQKDLDTDEFKLIVPTEQSALVGYFV